jgi:hypothetical protein
MIPKTADMIKSLMAGKGIEGPDFLGKGGPLASGLAIGATVGRGLGGIAGRSAIERIIVPSAERVAKGEKSSGYDRWISGYASRRGWIQPYDARQQVLKETQYRPKGSFGRRGEAPTTQKRYNMTSMNKMNKVDKGGGEGGITGPENVPKDG